MTNTPLSDSALEQDWPDFVAAVRSRLERGRRDYGDSTFERPITEVLDELEQELLDQSGWSFLLWCRLKALASRVQR